MTSNDRLPSDTHRSKAGSRSHPPVRATENATGTESSSGQFGPRLRSHRTARRLSLRRAAALAGLTPSYLSQIERGQTRPPSPQAISRLARVLRCDEDDLLILAGRLPYDIEMCLRRRPGLLSRLIRCADRYDDDELERLCQTLGSGPGSSGDPP